MTIYVLGTMYNISYVDKMDNDHVGETDFKKKTITILNDPTQDIDTVIKHEIMHAFFYEAGLLDYAKDELLMDFLAVQFWKIKDLMKEVTL